MSKKGIDFPPEEKKEKKRPHGLLFMFRQISMAYDNYEKYPHGIPTEVLDRYYALLDELNLADASDEVKMTEISARADAFVEEVQRSTTQEQEGVPLVASKAFDPSQRIEPTMASDLAIPVLTEEFSAQEQTQKVEGTPKEWREKLRGLIEGAKEKLGVGERGESLKGYMEGRLKELDGEAERKGIIEKGFRLLGEKYDKLGWKSKLSVGLALGIGAGVASAVSFPAAVACLSGVALQRAAGLSSSFLKYEKNVQDQKWGKEMAMGKAVRNAVFMTGGMLLLVEGVKESVDYANQNRWGEATHEWLKHHYPFAQAEIPAQVRAAGKIIPAPEATVQTPAVTEMSQIQAPAAAAAAEEVATPAVEPEPIVEALSVETGTPLVTEPPGTTPEIAVEATQGKGYEYMAKRLWEQVQERGLDSSQYAEGSDIRRLLEADASSINKVVHDLATDNEFFKPDGTSARIDLGSKMTFDANGNILVGENILAPESTPVTPLYTLEVSQETPAPVESLSEVPTPSVEAPLVQETIVTPEPIQAVDLTPAQEFGSQQNVEAPAPDESTAPMEAPTASEAPPLTVEHTKEFINPNKLLIDPLQGHVFQDPSGAVLAYGNDFDARFNAAQEFAKAHPNTSVWIQAEKPVFYEGAWRPWVQEMKYGGWWSGMHVDSVGGPANSTHIGAIRPDTFIKQLDK